MTFDEVQKKYWNKIYQRCLYALFFDEKMAFQITQEVFILLWKNWETLTGEKIEGWLRKTAKYKILQVQAKHTRSKLILSLNSEILTNYTQKADIIDQITDEKVAQNFEQYLQQIYSRLGTDEIQLAQYMRQKKRYSEIAQLLGIKEGAVSMRVSRLRRKVKLFAREILDGIL